ncbi:MAG TPA: peptide deformylase [Thermomicrobiales bacterium]|nr:peptide deformylase [Thermomicrobiales bacterium]
MALLDIVLEGDPRLRQKAHKIKHVDAGIRRLAADMYETMLDAPGVGLAGPQVGQMIRLITVYVPPDYDEEGSPEAKLILVNPEIVKASDALLVEPEGCLSIPYWIGDVPRADRVVVKARDLDFKELRVRATGYVARVLQHEIDHLDGVLFTDRVVDKSTLRYLTPKEGERVSAER